MDLGSCPPNCTWWLYCSEKSLSPVKWTSRCCPSEGIPTNLDSLTSCRTILQELVSASATEVHFPNIKNGGMQKHKLSAYNFDRSLRLPKNVFVSKKRNTKNTKYNHWKKKIVTGCVTQGSNLFPRNKIVNGYSNLSWTLIFSSLLL